ncbi:phage tail-collar fiber domain-containing protein [Scandinavium lactucae]|uniref:Phage tail protein n=1 Tax=Scandinavium lactucae TaxID=3095028 RepID=A0ABU4QTH5_9ENTR|nr:MULTISPECIES: phage tail protein [unclassified Scandinavium]MDX6042591.1 phage tail protein [Scandinavium sp. V105_6]MDX6052592.1 phage tail protein [Scandinavium sp. V105_1]
MAEKYYSILTNKGKELEAQSSATGKPVIIKDFVVGDGNGQAVRPDPAQTKLVCEVYRNAISALQVSPDQENQFIAQLVLPVDVGGFVVREVGLLTDAGELYSVANCAAIEKPENGVSVSLQYRLAVSETANVELKVATGDGLFLRIDKNLSEIAAKGEAAQKSSREAIGVLDATTVRKGLVQLSSATDSTSEGLAATPKAVKTVNDDLTGVKKSLGTAAIQDVTTSTSDPTPGRITKVGDGGLLGTALPVTDANLADKNGLVSMMFKQGGGSKSINFGSYGCGVHLLYGDSGDGSQALSANLFIDSSGNLSVEWLAIKKSDGSVVAKKKQKIWGPFNKPTPDDIGALPASRNALAVDLNTLGDRVNHGVYYQPSNAGATAAYHYPVTIAGTLFVTQSAYGCQQMYITYTGRLFLRAVQGAWTGSGPWSPWVEMYGSNNRPTPDIVNCIARDGSHIGGFVSGDAARPYLRHTASDAVVVLAKAGDSYTKAQSDAGYMAKTGAYTKGESDGRYPLKTSTVIDVRQGSPGTIVLKRNGWNYVPGGCAFTGWYVEGDAPLDDTIQYKPVQININGAWRTISG